MAINKERLSEIVREKKTFWWCQPYADSFIVREIRQPRVEVVVKDKYCVLIENDKECLVEFEHLTEDKEDAEELAEFSNITRTDTLKMPMWKEITDIIYGGSFGIQTIKKFDNCKFGYKLQLDGNVYIFVDKGANTLFMGSLTKENYDNARRLCVKLFRGESV